MTKAFDRYLEQQELIRLAQEAERERLHGDLIVAQIALSRVVTSLEQEDPPDTAEDDVLPPLRLALEVLKKLEQAQ